MTWYIQNYNSGKTKGGLKKSGQKEPEIYCTIINSHLAKILEQEVNCLMIK